MLTFFAELRIHLINDIFCVQFVALIVIFVCYFFYFTINSNAYRIIFRIVFDAWIEVFHNRLDRFVRICERWNTLSLNTAVILSGPTIDGHIVVTVEHDQSNKEKTKIMISTTFHSNYAIHNHSTVFSVHMLILHNKLKSSRISYIACLPFLHSFESSSWMICFVYRL